MRKYKRPLWAAVAVAMAFAVAACGSSGSSSSSTSSAAISSSSTTSGGTSSGKTGGTATLVEGTFPQSLDPSIDFTTQGAEVHWLTHLGAYSFAHASGAAGTQIIPSIATHLPTITDGGKTYTFTIRTGSEVLGRHARQGVGLHVLVRAGAEARMERGELPDEHDRRRSGLRQGKGEVGVWHLGQRLHRETVTIHLIKPYGAFVDVLAVGGRHAVHAGGIDADEARAEHPAGRASGRT